MRITKSWLREARSKVIESQVKLCALLASGGREALWEEHEKRFPHYIGKAPECTEQLLRELLYDDLVRAIPDHLID